MKVKIMTAKSTARAIALFWTVAVTVLLGGFALLCCFSERPAGENPYLWVWLCVGNAFCTALVYVVFCLLFSRSYHIFDNFTYRRYKRGEERLCIRWEDVFSMEYTHAAWLLTGNAFGGSLLIRYRDGANVTHTEEIAVSGKDLKQIKTVCPRHIGTK